MNTKLICAASLLIGASLLGGCASMKGDSTKLASTAVDDDNIDHEYIARVERQAKARGILIRWVHAPQRSKR